MQSSRALLSGSPIILLEERIWEGYIITIVRSSCVRKERRKNGQAYIVLEATDFPASYGVVCSLLPSIEA